MAIEIERKFLVAGDDWRADVLRTRTITQGYLSRDPERTVRVRHAGDQGYITVKAGLNPLCRIEFEYPIPAADALQLLELCPAPVIRKARHIWRDSDGREWEIDEFAAPEAGLILAEVELNSAGDDVRLPSWLGQEVTHDPKYTNSAMGLV